MQMFYGMQPVARMFYVLSIILRAHKVNDATDGKVDEPMLQSIRKGILCCANEGKDTVKTVSYVRLLSMGCYNYLNFMLRTVVNL